MAGERVLGSSGDDRVSNGMLALVLLVGTILTGLIRADYRRQAAALSVT